MEVATDINQSVYYYDKQSVTWLENRSCRVWISKVDSGETPSSDNAEAYLYFPDRTFKSERSQIATPIRPETVQEKIWRTLFQR